MPMSMTGSVSSASCSAAGPTDDSRGTAFQLALGLGRLGGLGGPLPGCCPSDMAGLQDAALRESRKSCNMTECVPVPSSEHVAEIVGRQGCKIKALRAKTNTYIKTPVRGEEPVFVVTGRRDDVTSAKREILSAAEHFSQIRASRRSGAAAATAANSGGSSFCTAVAASAAVSSLGAGCSQIVGSGTAPAVAPPGHVTAMVRVPYRVVGLVVGPKGATIKRIQQATGTYIVTPSREKDPVFEITGLPESVSKARAEIERHIASRAAGVGEPMASVGEPMASVGSLCGTATAAGCFLDAGGCGVCGGCRRASDCEALLGFGNGGSCCVSYSARPCRDPTSAGSCFPYSSPLASAIAAAAAAAAQQQQAADLLDLGRLDGIAASADDIMSVRGEDDSGCASLAGDLDCAAAGGVAAAITAGAPIRHLPYSTSSIWYNPAPCGASALAGGPAALRADSLRQPLYSAAADRCLVQPRRHSAGARQSPAAAVSGDPCDGSGCCQAPSSRRCSHEANDGTAAQQLRAATGFPSAAVGAFPASSSSSSGCSSTSTSPVVERRLLCGGDAISYFGGGGSGRQQLAGYGGLPLGGEEEGTEGSRRSGGSSFTASTTTYPWCYGLDQAASAFDERVCGSL